MSTQRNLDEVREAIYRATEKLIEQWTVCDHGIKLMVDHLSKGIAAADRVREQGDPDKLCKAIWLLDGIGRLMRSATEKSRAPQRALHILRNPDSGPPLPEGVSYPELLEHAIGESAASEQQVVYLEKAAANELKSLEELVVP